MSNRGILFAFIILLCGVALGFYQKWFVVQSQKDLDSDKVHVNLTIDPDKAKADVERLKEKISDANNPTPPGNTTNPAKLSTMITKGALL